MMKRIPHFTALELAQWADGEWSVPPVGELRGVCSDTRALPEGCLFLAIRGDRFDGHDFLPAAAAAGAGGALVDREYPVAEAPLPLLRVNDTRRALARLAHGYRMQSQAAIVGLTGSAGKTTVKEMLLHLLGQVGTTAGTRGNWNNDIGLPLSMLAMPRDADFGVFEVGTNHPGEVATLSRILAPTAALVTNVGPSHIEFFGSEAAIADEKSDLLRCLPAEGTAVLDADGAWYRYLSQQVPGRRLTVSLAGRPADVAATTFDAVAGRCEIQDAADGRRYALAPGAPGTHMLSNALMASAMARACGVPWSVIEQALPSAPMAPMRWEVLDVEGVTVVNDAYNANPLSMRHAIDTFEASVPAPRRFLVLGEMLELGDDAPAEHAALGERIGARPWTALFTVGALGAEIARGARRVGLGPEVRIDSFDTALEAGEALADAVRPGDAVLLKASRAIRLEQVVSVLRQQREGHDA